ncbi:glycoside hydrolase family 71 protein [Mycena galericulata]|nr:glycoside hydrolase family 71 protein [Mycena galericulata]
MRPSNLFLHSFGLLCLVLSVASTPVDSLDSLFDSESDQSAPEHSYPHASPAVPSNLVVAHHIVGLTEKYTDEDWCSDIRLAGDTGIDGFMLNVGGDSWQFGQVQRAFSAAADCSPGFKLGISFDMTSIPCSKSDDAKLLQNYINVLRGHPLYLSFNSRPLFSAFSGEDCTFERESPNAGWNDVIKPGDATEQVYFVPSFFVDPASLPSWTAMDGACDWDAAWPNGDNPIEFDSDNRWIDNLDGRTYMAGVSPWFFTHYSPQTYNKNFIYQFDDWMFTRRWELLMANRDKVPIVQLLTWNDFGESHYLGPLLPHTSQPNSQAWVDGFDHTGWLDLFAYYIEAFKTDAYPDITRDRIFLWARLYPSSASTLDPVGKPDNWEWTQDYLWAVCLLSAPADVVLQCGSTKQEATNVPAGLAKFKLPLTTACNVAALIEREDGSGVRFEPEGMRFTTEPQQAYNFNAFVAASP